MTFNIFLSYRDSRLSRNGKIFLRIISFINFWCAHERTTSTAVKLFQLSGVIRTLSWRRGTRPRESSSSVISGSDGMRTGQGSNRRRRGRRRTTDWLGKWKGRLLMKVSWNRILVPSRRPRRRIWSAVNSGVCWERVVWWDTRQRNSNVHKLLRRMRI